MDTKRRIASASTDVTVKRLPNGLTVLLEPLPHVWSVATGVYILAGSACETPEESGICHFLEHLFFKGTVTRTARQLVEAIERYGGQLNGYTSRDYTCLHVQTLDSHAATGIEILGDIVRNSTFCDFEKERNVVLEEIASVEDVPEDHIHDLFGERIWPHHALGRPITGSTESVSGITPDDIRRFYEAWYRPSNMVVSVAGRFEPEKVTEWIEAAFDMPPSPGVTLPASVPEWASGIDCIERDTSQSHFCFGFPAPQANSGDRHAYQILNCALGGGATSRLFDRIRENEGLSYSIYSFLSSYRTSGVLGVYAAVAPENARRASQLAFEEVRKFRDEPIPEDELDMNREQLKGLTLMALEQTYVRMARMAKTTIYYGRVISADEAIALLDRVTAADIQNAAQRMFHAGSCMFVSLGPQNGDARYEIPL